MFANLVDFDTVYGHRNDVEGYAGNLERFDARLAGLLPRAGGTVRCDGRIAAALQSPALAGRTVRAVTVLPPQRLYTLALLLILSRSPAAQCGFQWSE